MISTKVELSTFSIISKELGWMLTTMILIRMSNKRVIITRFENMTLVVCLQILWYYKGEEIQEKEENKQNEKE